MRPHVLVLGCGIAGMLAAHVLSEHADVTVIERDTLPTIPHGRRGTPQDRHTHVLVSGGARALDSLMPSLTAEVTARGARHIPLPTDYLQHSAGGWLRRLPEMQYILGCSRPLLEWAIRDRLRRNTAVVIREDTDAVGLTTEHGRVTGARIQDRATGKAELLHAALVVDATGRTSHLGQWLTELSMAPIPEVAIDPRLFYATRIYRAPKLVSTRFPAVNIQADPDAPQGRRSGLLMPIEDGLWSVTMTGSRGNEPGTSADKFIAAARRLPHPVIADLLDAAEPLGPAAGFRPDANRKKLLTRGATPPGLLVIGDAATVFNPVYGHGMAVAALGAVALRDELIRYGLNPQHTWKIQRKISAAGDTAWRMATSQDLLYTSTTGSSGRLFGVRLQHRFQQRLARAGTDAIAAASLAVYTLSEPVSRLGAPRVLLDALRGGPQELHAEPPFTSTERQVFG
ncbi:FAD-dependent monooxygenase [Kutzneria albida]|nr:FAD-dependent monooxygenase [Kutzneria albida]